MGLYLHNGLATQKIHQNQNPILSRHDLGNNGFQAMEDTPGDMNLVAWRDLIRNDMNPLRSDYPANLLNGCIRHGRPLDTKVNNPGNPRGVMNSIQHELPVKTRKEIIRKHGLGDRDWPQTSVPCETHARIKHINSFNLPQMACGNMFMLRLGAKAEPSGGGKRFAS